MLPCPTNFNLVRSKWIYRIKRNSNDNIERHKTRLVDHGYSRGGNRLLRHFYSSYQAYNNLPRSVSSYFQRMVNNTFLNGDLQEVVYMKQPQWFINPTKPSHASRLNKALYGLKRAPRFWFAKLKTYLITQGFKAFQSDTSLFVHHSSLVIIYVLVYVDDDLIVTCTNASLLQHFIAQLHHNFAMKDLGNVLHFFFGIQITRNATPAP